MRKRWTGTEQTESRCQAPPGALYVVWPLELHPPTVSPTQEDSVGKKQAAVKTNRKEWERDRFAQRHLEKTIFEICLVKNKRSLDRL